MQDCCDIVDSSMVTIWTDATTRVDEACTIAVDWCKKNTDIEDPVCQIANYLSPINKVLAGHTQVSKA